MRGPLFPSEEVICPLSVEELKIVLKYVIRRLLLMILVMFCVVLFVFILGRVSGDPVATMLGEGYTMEEYNAVKHEMGLDRPYVVQFFEYIKNIILHFDLGTSYQTREPIINEIRMRFPISLKIAIFTMLWSIPVGVIVGIISAIKQYSKVDVALTSSAMILASLPNFWSALMLIILFSLNWKLLPATGLDSWTGYIMPCIALGLRRVAIFCRMTRSTMLGVMRSDYVRTARSKGINEKIVIFKHMLPNAAIPVIAMLTNSFEIIIGGSAVIENIFRIPGLGSYLIFSINTGDYPAVQGSVLVLSLVVCVLNFLSDLCYALIDPRIKAKYKNSGSTRKVNREIKKMARGQVA